MAHSPTETPIRAIIDQQLLMLVPDEQRRDQLIQQGIYGRVLQDIITFGVPGLKDTHIQGTDRERPIMEQIAVVRYIDAYGIMEATRVARNSIQYTLREDRDFKWEPAGPRTA